MKKKVFTGYTISTLNPIWTMFNTFNLTAVVQKKWHEAYIRYNDGTNNNKISKVRITIEVVK